MTREEAIRQMLARQAPGTKVHMVQIAVQRTTDYWDLWGPGHCSCGPATCVGLTLEAAVQQILAWRPGTVKA